MGQISNERRRVRGTQCNHPPAAPQHRSPPPIARRAPQPSSTVCWRAGQGGGSPKVDGADAQAGPEAEREHRPLSFPPTRVRGQRGRPEGLRSRELPALGEQSFPRRGALPRAPMCAKLEAMCPSLLTRPGWSVRLRGAFGTIWRFPVDRPSPEKRASDLGGWPMAESAAQVGYSAHEALGAKLRPRPVGQAAAAVGHVRPLPRPRVSSVVPRLNVSPAMLRPPHECAAPADGVYGDNMYFKTCNRSNGCWDLGVGANASSALFRLHPPSVQPSAKGFCSHAS